MVLDSWEGVSGVPGLGVSIPRSRTTSISHQPLQKNINNQKKEVNKDKKLLGFWENNKQKEMNKTKLKVGSSSRQHPSKADIGKINVQLPRVLSTRSSSFSSSGGGGPSNTENSPSLVKYSNGGFSKPEIKYSNAGFSLPPPLPRVQASSNSVRKSGGKQWRQITGYNQRYQGNQQKMEQHHHQGNQQKMEQHHHQGNQQKMEQHHQYHQGNQQRMEQHPHPPLQSHSPSLQSSHRIHQRRPLSKSKSLRTNEKHRWSFHDRFSLVESQDNGPNSLPLEVGSLPLDCNYYPCSSCNCCCDRHKGSKKRVMFRDVSPSIISGMLWDDSPSINSGMFRNDSPSISSSCSLSGRKGVVGVKEHLGGKQHRGSFESSEGGSEDVVGYGDQVEGDGGSHKDCELYYSRPPDDSEWYSSSLMSDNASHVTPKHPNLGVNEKDESGCDHYQSPREVDGDYSYAYSDCISPAFLIRAESYNNYEYDENIYEEINVGSKVQEELGSKVARKGDDSIKEGRDADRYSSGSSTSSSKMNLKQVIEKIRRKCCANNSQVNHTEKVEAVSRRSSKVEGVSRRCCDGLLQDSEGGEGKAMFDSEGGEGKAMFDSEGGEGKAMFGELEEVNRVMSQLHLDVKDLLQPLTCSIYPRRPQDSGFNSGGMSSITSSSPSSSKKSLVSRTPSYEEVDSSSIKTCESINIANQQSKISSNSVRVSLVDMDHTIEDLDHIVSVLKGDMNHQL